MDGVSKNGELKSNCFVFDEEGLKGVLKRCSGVVKTRFPPEPNGPLHIGHAKAIYINYATAKQYGGEFILRYDDTNPDSIKPNAYEDILEMMCWLGYKPDRITYASDYFEDLYELAVKLIEKDLAYICHEGSRKRMDPREIAHTTDSQTRNRSIDDNIKEFLKMKAGLYDCEDAVLRLKFVSKEGFRDPVMYRIKKVSHCRTAKKWNIYPTYDFAHCICDFLEGIAVSLCSEEFRSHRVLYEWLLSKLELPKAEQHEYSRLKVPYNITSKSKLEDIKHLFEGIDDPRLLTLAGLRRRGIKPGQIMEFVFSKTTYEIERLYDVVRADNDKKSFRLFAVIDPLECNIVNFGKYLAEVENDPNEPLTLKFPVLPGEEGGRSRTFLISDKIYINRFDFLRENVKSKHYLTLSSPVILKQLNAIMEVVEVGKQESQRITHLEVTLKPLSQNERPKGRKVITWVSDHVIATLNIFQNLLKPTQHMEESVLEILNPVSKLQLRILVEQSLSKFARVGG